MERVKGIGGVFIRAGDSDELAAWYRDKLGVDVGEWGGTVFEWRHADDPERAGSTTWSLFRADSDYLGSPDNRFMINYRVDDLDKMLAQLRAAGVEVDDKIEESDFGRFGWAVDPDGNRIELWQPADGM